MVSSSSIHLGVGVAGEAVVTSGGADRLGVAAGVQIEHSVWINGAGAVTEHVQAGFAVSHVGVGIGTEVDVGIETAGFEHFHQHGHDVTVDALKALDRGRYCCAVFLPQSIGVLGEASGGHQFFGFSQVRGHRLHGLRGIGLEFCLYGFAFGKLLPSSGRAGTDRHWRSWRHRRRHR